MASSKFRIVGLQPVDPCCCCGDKGHVRWQGKSYCVRHCCEEARIQNILFRVGAAARQLAGADYDVKVTITPKAQRTAVAILDMGPARLEMQAGPGRTLDGPYAPPEESQP